MAYPSYTYAAGSSANDVVRLLVGDTDADDWLLSDEEIAVFTAAQPSNNYLAAAEAAQAIAAKFARKTSRAVGDLRMELQQRYEHYVALAEYLQRRGAAGVVPYAGGLSIDDKSDVDDDTDRVRPAFRIGLMDDPGAGSSADVVLTTVEQ